LRISALTTHVFIPVIFTSVPLYLSESDYLCFPAPLVQLTLDPAGAVPACQSFYFGHISNEAAR
jgi:hypothetical protein